MGLAVTEARSRVRPEVLEKELRWPGAGVLERRPEEARGPAPNSGRENVLERFQGLSVVGRSTVCRNPD